MGSDTPKYIRPIPMPAAKSMAIQEKKPYCGSELSAPKRMLPNLLKATANRKMTKKETSRMYIQLRFL